MKTLASSTFYYLFFMLSSLVSIDFVSAQSNSPFSNKVSGPSSGSGIGNLSTQITAPITPSPTTSGPVTTITWKYDHSSFGDPNVGLEPNGRGEAYAFACQSAIVSYSRASSAARNAGSTIISHSTYVSITTYSSGVADIYTTLCDKFPRAHGSGPISSVPIYKTGTLSDYTETIYNSQIPKIQPSCNINANDCAPLLSSYSLESAAFEQFQSSFTQPFAVTPKPQPPACNPPISPPPGCTTCCGQCTIAGGNVELLYWPVTVEGDFCGQRTTITNNATTTQSLVSNGMTFVSPSVYVSFKSLYAFDNCNSEIGKPIDNTILAMQPDKLSSARGYHLGGRTAYSLNYADLNVPVPASAYCAQVQFDWIPCNTIYDEGYTSWMLWLPDEVSTMRPEWSSCGKAVWGVYDPPHALQTVNELTPDVSSSRSKEPQVPAPTTTKKSAVVTGHQTETAAPAHTQPGVPKPTQSPVGSKDPEIDVPGSQGSGNQDPASQKPNAQDPKASNPALASNVVGHVGNAIASVIGLVKPDSTVTSGVASGSPTATLERFDSAGIIVHGTTVPFSKLTDGYQASTTTDASGAHIFVLAPGSTLTVGGKPTTINGHTLTAEQGGVVVDGSATIAYAGFAAATRNSSIGSTSVLQVTTSEGRLMRPIALSYLSLVLLLAYM